MADQFYRWIGIVVACIGSSLFLYGWIAFYLSFSPKGTFCTAIIGIVLIVIGVITFHYGMCLGDFFLC